MLSGVGPLGGSGHDVSVTETSLTDSWASGFV